MRRNEYEAIGQSLQTTEHVLLVHDKLFGNDFDTTGRGEVGADQDTHDLYGIDGVQAWTNNSDRVI